MLDLKTAALNLIEAVKDQAIKITKSKENQRRYCLYILIYYAIFSAIVLTAYFNVATLNRIFNNGVDFELWFAHTHAPTIMILTSILMSFIVFEEEKEITGA